MEKFEVTILGCGAASPTSRLHLSAQVVTHRNKHFLVDCGEGTQMQLRRLHIGLNNIYHIFISHLHGDHCLGLPGLLSTLSLLDVSDTIVVHSPAGLQAAVMPLINATCHGLNYNIRWEEFPTDRSTTIYEDKLLTILTIPLAHRVPCCGFLFKEKPSRPHLRGDLLSHYSIPHYEREAIKNGADYTMPDGTVIAHSNLTTPAAPPRTYAYCSDTMPDDSIMPLINAATLLYHEATYLDRDAELAQKWYHTTSLQAAQIAHRSNANTLLLGHFSARYPDLNSFLQEAQSVFPNTYIAEEGKAYPIA